MKYPSTKMNKSHLSKSKYWMMIALLLTLLIATPAFARHVDVIRIEGAITPVTAKYIEDAVEKSARENAECLIIEMDTPGGLMQSTWTIDKVLLSDQIPVVVYITPSGGRAASAGVFISYAAHIVAMAPSTNIGSAHPVSMVGNDSSKVMMDKVTNDAVAHIKGLAEKRGRNAEWAENAVRNSVNITEKEALELGVINFICRNLDELLDELDGQTVLLNGDEVVLNTDRAEIREAPMSWRYKILNVISDPNIAFLLMLMGLAGLYFELQNPGAIFPGAVGAISLILAAFAFQILPINIVGILLILLAVVFFILEVNITSFGLLTIGGIVSMTLGALMLFRTPGIKVSLHIIIPAVLATAAFFVVAVGFAIRAQRKKPTTGQKGLVGEIGEVVKALNPQGQVSVHGEIWKASSTENIKKGESVEVLSIDGLMLTVRKVSN